MAHSNKVLGKGLIDLGLGDLLSQKTSAPDAPHQTMAIDQLMPGRYQPRRHMDQDALNELASSIAQQGIIQPIIVRAQSKGDNKYYEIIAGERRWKAAQLAKLKRVPVIIRKVDDQQAMAFALIENIQREDLNAVEEAMAVSRLIETYRLTHQKAAEILGKSRPNISNTLRLLNLDDAILDWLARDQLERGHALALLALEDVEQRLALAHRVVAKRASVRETEAWVRQLRQKDAHATPKQDPTTRAALDMFDPKIDQLHRALNRKVTLRVNAKGRGQLMIHFNDPAQLTALLNTLAKGIPTHD